MKDSSIHTQVHEHKSQKEAAAAAPPPPPLSSSVAKKCIHVQNYECHHIRIYLFNLIVANCIAWTEHNKNLRKFCTLCECHSFSVLPLALFLLSRVCVPILCRNFVAMSFCITKGSEQSIQNIYSTFFCQLTWFTQRHAQCTRLRINANIEHINRQEKYITDKQLVFSIGMLLLFRNVLTDEEKLKLTNGKCVARFSVWTHSHRKKKKFQHNKLFAHSSIHPSWCLIMVCVFVN